MADYRQSNRPTPAVELSGPVAVRNTWDHAAPQMWVSAETAEAILNGQGAAGYGYELVGYELVNPDGTRPTPIDWSIL